MKYPLHKMPKSKLNFEKGFQIDARKIFVSAYQIRISY